MAELSKGSKRIYGEAAFEVLGKAQDLPAISVHLYCLVRAQQRDSGQGEGVRNFCYPALRPGEGLSGLSRL